MTIAFNSSAITISGTTSYETPETLLADSSITDTIAEEVSPHVLHIHGRNLIINGSWDDTGWTILFDQEKYPYTNSADATWKSGNNTNGEYVGGANYILNVPSTSYTERTIVHTSSKLFWYGINFFIYLPDPLGSLNSNTACRLVVTNTNALSIINASFSSVGKGGYMKCGTTGVVENSIFLKGGIYLRPIAGVEFTNFSMNGDADGNANSVRIYYNDGASSGSGGPLTIAGFVPRVASSGEIRIRNGDHFGSAPSIDRKTSLPDCVLDTAKLRLQGDHHTVEIDTNLEITVDGITTKSGVNVGVYNNNKSHDFAIKSLTNSEGVYTGKTIGDWRGYVPNTSTDSDWIAPTTANITNRKSKKIILRRFDLTEQIISPDIGADGKYSTLVFMQDDTKVTGTKAQAAAIAGVAINKTNTSITIDADVSTQDIFNFYKQWIALDAQLNQDNFIVIDGKTLDLGSWNLIVNSGKTLSGTDDINKINTSGSVTANGSIDVPYVDSSGIVVVLTCNQANAKIFYQIDPDSGATDTENYVTASSNGKYSITGVPILSHIYVVAKKDGFDYYKTDFDPAVTSEVQLPLGSLDAIDTSIDISAYVFESGNSSNDDNFYADYNSTGKSFFVMGETDLAPSTGRQALSRRVFDHMWSTEEAMKLLNYWDRSGSITKLDGRPYKIVRGKININKTKTDFSRVPGLLASEASYFGEYVADEDNNVYRAPFSNNALIDFADPTDAIESTPEERKKFAVACREEFDANSEALSAIKDKTDDLLFTNGRVNADVINTNAEHILAISGSQERIYGFDENMTRDESQDFVAHTTTTDIKAIKYWKGRYYVMDRVNTTTLRFYVYKTSGKFESTFDIAILSSQDAEDFTIHTDPHGVDILRILINAATNKILTYYLNTRAAIPDDDILLGSVESPIAMDIRSKFLYIVDGKASPATTRQVIPINMFTAVVDTANIFNLSDTVEPIAIVALLDEIVIIDGDDNDAHFYTYDGTHSDNVVSLPSGITDIEGLAHFKASPLELQFIHDGIANIESKTDRLGFNSDDDVLATLNNELVTTDAASRTASKADATDLSALATKATQTAIKTQVDKLNFDGNNVKSTEQSQTNILAEHILVSDNEDDKAYALDEGNARIPKLDFTLHGDHQHATGFAEFEGNLYGLDADRPDEVDVFIYSRTGKDIAKITLAVPTQGAQDISVGRDPDGQVVIRILNDGTVNKLFAFDRDTLAEITAKTLTLSDVETPLAYYEYEGLAYITDARANLNDTPRVRVVKQSDGTLDTAKSFNLPTTFKTATAIIVTRHYIKIINQPTRLLGVFKHDGNSIGTTTLPVEIADASGMVWITSPIQDVKQVLDDITQMDKKVSNVEDHITNDTEYDPATSILSVKNKDATANLAQYDIKDENDNPTGTGSHAYQRIKK